MSAPTVIVGAGIIGTSTAYYLSRYQSPSSIHLVEICPELFASASGNAGGFLSKNWFSAAVTSLGALSFEEHRKLAQLENGRARWGYSPSTSITLASSSSEEKVDIWFHNGSSRAGAARGETALGTAPLWLCQEKDDTVDILSNGETTAQVDPLRLSQFLLQRCLESGVQLHHPARPTAVMRDTNSKICGIKIADMNSTTERDVSCSNIIIAAGAWSPQVFATLFPRSSCKLPISSLAGHSLVVKSPRWIEEHEKNGCHAVFLSSTPGYSPEIFSRIGGHIYVGGLNSASEPLPRVASDSSSNVSQSAVAKLRATAKDLLAKSGEQGTDDLELVRSSLCFRPVTDDGSPIISRIDEDVLGDGVQASSDGGIYLAAGHGPWGISLSLGTGKVMAEMVQGRELSANVSALALKI